MEAILITIEEAARRLSLSRTTIYTLMNSGELASVKMGRSRRIEAASLETFVANRLSTDLPVSPAASD